MTEQINNIAELWWGWMWPMFWQVGVLVGVVWIIDLMIRQRVWPQVRYALWLLVLLKLVLPPGLSAPTSVTSGLQPLAEQTLKETLSPEQPTVAVQIEESELVPASPTKMPIMEPSKPAATTNDFEVPVVPAVFRPSGPTLCRQAYAMLGWLAGVLVLTAWLMLRLRQLRRLHRRDPDATDPPQWFNELLSDVAGKLNLRCVPQVVLSPSVASPAVFGAFRPVLLMPAEDTRKLSRKELEHVLLHELAHVKRGDLKVHGFYMLLQIIYWFNPLLWLVRRHLQHLRELCCDATVARVLREETLGYRETILETARRLLAKPVEPGMGLLGLFEDSNRLMVRLKWLEKKTWKYRRPRIATISIIVAIMSACVLPMAKVAKEPEPSEMPGVVEEVITAKDFGQNRAFNLRTGEFVDLETSPSEDAPLLQWTRLAGAGHEEHIGLFADNMHLASVAGGKEVKRHADLWTAESIESLTKIFDLKLDSIDSSWDESRGWFIGPPSVKWPYVAVFSGTDGTTGILEMTGVENQSVLIKYKILPHSDDPDSDAGTAEPSESQFSATLANGVTVELVGVCEHPSAGKQWWRPDGSELEERPYDRIGGQVHPDAKQRAFEFAIELGNLPTDEISTKVEAEEAGGGSSSGNKTQISGSGEYLSDFRWMATSFVKDLEACTIKVAVAAGSWVTVAKSYGKSSSSRGTAAGGVSFSKAYEVASGDETDLAVAITVTDDILDRPCRIVAVTNSGELVRAHRTSGSSAGKARQTTVYFKYPASITGLPDWEYHFQTRPYEWVELRNVSLRPGVKTNVEVEGVNLPVGFISSDNDGKVERYHWRLNLTQPVRLCRHSFIIEGDFIRGYWGSIDGTLTSPADGTNVDYQLIMSKEGDKLDYLMREQQSHKGLNGYDYAASSERKQIAQPECDQIRTYILKEPVGLSEKYLPLWKREFVRDGSIIKTLIYAVRIKGEKEDDPFVPTIKDITENTNDMIVVEKPAVDVEGGVGEQVTDGRGEVFDVESGSVIEAVGNKATLESGTIVELLGVTRVPVRDQPSWKPDGSFLEPLFDRVDYEPSQDPNSDKFEYYALPVRLENTPVDELGLIKWRFDDAKGYPGSANAYLGRERLYEKGLIVGAVKFAKESKVDSTTLFLGIASGQWRTIAAGRHWGVYHNGGDSIIVGEPTSGGPGGVFGEPGVHIGVTYNITDRQFRVVAVDKEGNIHLSRRTGSGGTDNLRFTTGSFHNLERDQLEEYRFDVRPYEWVKFKDVSLRPGTETQVEVDNGWGRVEGQVFIGRSVGSGENICLYPLLFDANNNFLRVGKELSMVSDADGRFVFDKVPVGWVSVGRQVLISSVPLHGGSYSPSSTFTNRTQVEVKANQTVNIVLGGAGRPVIGRFAAPADYGQAMDFSDGIRALTTAWPKSDKSKYQSSEYKHFAFQIKQDGTFRIEDVPAGTYELYVSMDQQPLDGKQWKTIADFSDVIEVPAMIESRMDEPLDLGTLQLKLPGAEVDLATTVEAEAEQGGRLEFRIVPSVGSDQQSNLTEREFGRYCKDLAEAGPELGRQRGDEFAWFEIESDDDGDSGDDKWYERLAHRQYQGRTYLLMGNISSQAMIPQIDGKWIWGLLDVRAGQDNRAKPMVVVDFDQTASKMFYQLTKSNIHSQLAIILDGKVLSAPRIENPVRSRAIITGNFTEQQVDKMVESIRKGMITRQPQPIEVGPKISFEEKVRDLGEVGPGTKNVCEFNFKNTGDALLEIKNVEKTCGCTIFSLKKTKYAPGESGSIKVTYSASERIGKVSRKLFVSSNDKKDPGITLTIKAMVALKVRPQPDRLELILKDSEASCPQITLTSVDGTPFAIKSFKSPGKCITASFDRKAKAASFVLEPKVNAGKLKKNRIGLIKITVTHPQCKLVTIRYSVLARFKVAPAFIIARNVEPAEPIKREVWISNNYDEDFEIESVSSQNEITKLVKQQKIDRRYKLELEITPPPVKGSQTMFRDVLYVNIKDGEKLRITCRGIYAKPKRESVTEGKVKRKILDR
jgi:beta-lactamase regulating signal transducer with metallopeptidase domain